MVIHPTSRGRRLTAEAYLALLEDTSLLCFLWIRTGKISLQVPKSSAHSVRIQQQAHPNFHRPKLIRSILEHPRSIQLSFTFKDSAYSRVSPTRARALTDVKHLLLPIARHNLDNVVASIVAHDVRRSSRVHKGFGALYLSTGFPVSVSIPGSIAVWIAAPN